MQTWNTAAYFIKLSENIWETFFFFFTPYKVAPVVSNLRQQDLRHMINSRITLHVSQVQSCGSATMCTAHHADLAHLHCIMEILSLLSFNSSKAQLLQILLLSARQCILLQRISEHPVITQWIKSTQRLPWAFSWKTSQFKTSWPWMAIMSRFLSPFLCWKKFKLSFLLVTF